MKLLILTQAVDRQDTFLGFFHRWIEEFAKNYESILVICLKEGEHSLPSNVKVLSLGKEKFEIRNSKFVILQKVKYVLTFWKYIWRERNNYDVVFVHMNEEYVLLGWKTWFLLGKKVYMWRNHHEGGLLTDMAAMFCRKVFCTSKFSYTAKYKKTVLMPIGVDTEVFRMMNHESRINNSILFLGRMAPVKKPDLLLEALSGLRSKGIEFTADFVGDALDKDREYLNNLKSKANIMGVQFLPGVPNDRTPQIYAEHEIFVNLSTSGMYDKTIIEAMASGCLVLASNENLRGHIDDMFIFKEGDRAELESKLQTLLMLPGDAKLEARKNLRAFAEMHSLKSLGDKLCVQMS